MADLKVSIRDAIWGEFVKVARRRHKRPEALANELLDEAVQRVADEQLLRDSERSARRSGLRMKDVEEVIRAYRREKALRVSNGRTKTANSRRA